MLLRYALKGGNRSFLLVFVLKLTWLSECTGFLISSVLIIFALGLAHELSHIHIDKVIVANIIPN